MNRGRFSSAETILEAALRHPGPQVVTVGQLLAQLYWKQGRTYERRAVIESSWRIASRPGWPRPEEALGLLRDHMAVDFVSLAVDAFRTLLDRAGRAGSPGRSCLAGVGQPGNPRRPVRRRAAADR